MSRVLPFEKSRQDADLLAVIVVAEEQRVVGGLPQVHQQSNTRLVGFAGGAVGKLQ